MYTRVSEIAGLRVGDVIVETSRPHLRLRKETTKGKKPRMVPLWWDAGTLADFKAWKAERQAAGSDAPFVCSVQAHRRGQPLQRAAIRRRFLSACKVLGRARLATLTIHHGRHTFISHALAGGRMLPNWRPMGGCGLHREFGKGMAVGERPVQDWYPVACLVHGTVLGQKRSGFPVPAG